MNNAKEIELCTSYIKSLAENNMVSLTDQRLEALEMGKLMARFYVRLQLCCALFF